MSHVMTSFLFLVVFCMFISQIYTKPIRDTAAPRDKRTLNPYISNTLLFKPNTQFTLAPVIPSAVNYQYYIPTTASTIHNQPEYIRNSYNYPEIDSYSVNGRILKQYEVVDRIHEEEKNELLFNENNNGFSNSRSNLGFGRALNQDFYNQDVLSNCLNSNLCLFGNNFENFPKIVPNSNLNSRRPAGKPLYIRNHGPVALGSGSLGYLRLPNGVVFIGSGSLGYINEQQHSQTIQDKQRSLNLQAGPLSFGPGNN